MFFLRQVANHPICVNFFVDNVSVDSPLSKRVR